jgi:hypothetical protein
MESWHKYTIHPKCIPLHLEQKKSYLLYCCFRSSGCSRYRKLRWKTSNQPIQHDQPLHARMKIKHAEQPYGRTAAAHRKEWPP